MNKKHLEKAIEIRAVEERLLDLFSKGKLSGTVHTSIGQEYSAIAFCHEKLSEGDRVLSNHRCHGHYLAFTNDVEGFISEMMGSGSGVCGGIGSSQHLFSPSFMSNGTQANLAPVAAGIALNFTLKDQDNIALLFIGDGTLGEGVVYETMNIASLWNLPLLIVCENNKYAQSTPIENNLAGSIKGRAESFGIKYYHGSTTDPESLISLASESIDFVRRRSNPAFFEVDTYRLAAHSKGDDDRDIEEIRTYEMTDPLNVYMNSNQAEYQNIRQLIEAKLDKIISLAETSPRTKLDDYYIPGSNTNVAKPKLTKLASVKKFQGKLLNEYFATKMKDDLNTIFIGEDVLSPYGGAFKIARNLSDLYPNRVFSTPISEAAIAGIGNGLAIAGFKPYVEIMFGDFTPLIMEQIINGSSKFQHMYNHHISCPVVYRTPMGGKRGYGPTHSQSLERFLIGIDNVKVYSLNALIDPGIIYEKVHAETCPCIVIENKLDYGRFILKDIPSGYSAFMTDENDATFIIKKVNVKPDVTIFTYGGSVTDTLLAVAEYPDEVNFELIIPSVIHPLNIECLIDSLEQSNQLFTVEEGSLYGGVSSELIATIHDRVPNLNFNLKRIGSIPVPIPSVRGLEDEVLPSKKRIIAGLEELFNGNN
jgi:2-oxoisovalerate dehydrogenase E1 component